MKKWNDFFSEEPSKQHEQNVLSSAEQMLETIRAKQPKKNFIQQYWLPGFGLGLASALALVLWNRSKQSQFEQDMSLADFIENEDDAEDLIDDEVDLELLSELEEFEELEDSGVLDKELENERS